tara:strand:+ start:306 stop:746 length:441 start_codon:yes stop_codon:yes gene_type:complete
MGAPKGNKFALGKATGRPRTVSPSPQECIKLGEEMVDWVKKNNPTHLTEWYSLEKFIPWKMWNAMCELKEFLPYYEVALNLIARNARNGILEKSIAQRFLSLYHRDLKAEERETAKYQADLKKEQEEKEHKSLCDIRDALRSAVNK